MKLAREGAWKFAKTISEIPENDVDKLMIYIHRLQTQNNSSKRPESSYVIS